MFVYAIQIAPHTHFRQPCRTVLRKSVQIQVEQYNCIRVKCIATAVLIDFL